MQLDIRRAEKGDEALLLDYICKHARFAGVDEMLQITLDKVEKAFFEDGLATALIACVKDSPVGFTVYYNKFSPLTSEREVFIEDLYIDEDHRGRGYGEDLVRDAFRRIKEEGVGRVSWHCVKDNEKPQKMYYNLGSFEEEGLTNFFMDLGRV